MIGRPPSSPLFPYTPLFRSIPHRMVAFGARQTCIDVWLRPPQSRLTQSRHEPGRTITFKSPGSTPDRKSTRLNSSHSQISYAVFCLKKKNKTSISHCVKKEH